MSEEYKSKHIYKYRNLIDAAAMLWLQESLDEEPNPPGLVGIQYKKIRMNPPIYDCVFLLNQPFQSLPDKTGSELLGVIKSEIPKKFWKITTKIYSYEIYLEGDHVEEIEAAERECPLPFIIEPFSGDKNAYTLYSYYDAESIARGVLIIDLIMDSEKYVALYGPKPHFKPLLELASVLAIQLQPEKQIKTNASRLLFMKPEHAAIKLVSYSPLMRQEVVACLEKSREAKDSAEQAELIMLHAAELDVIKPKEEALHLLSLGPEEATDLCLKAKLKGDSKVVKALGEIKDWEKHGDKAKIVQENVQKKLMQCEASSFFELSPAQAAESLYRYDPQTRLKYIVFLGQLRDDKPSHNKKVEEIFAALLVKSGLKPTPPPSAPSTADSKVGATSSDTEDDIEDDTEDNKEKSRDVTSVVPAHIPRRLSIYSTNDNTPTILEDKGDQKRYQNPTYEQIPPAPPPSPEPPAPLVAQANHMSLEMKVFIGFICISIMGAAGYGTYRLLEKFEKINATREFFSNNYMNIIAGSLGVMGILALIGLMVHCKRCYENNQDAVRVPNNVIPPIYPRLRPFASPNS